MWDILSRLFGTFERPSPSDITPRSSIVEGNTFVKIKLDNLNIPFNLLSKLSRATTGCLNGILSNIALGVARIGRR